MIRIQVYLVWGCVRYGGVPVPGLQVPVRRTGHVHPVVDSQLHTRSYPLQAPATMYAFRNFIEFVLRAQLYTLFIQYYTGEPCRLSECHVRTQSEASLHNTVQYLVTDFTISVFIDLT